MIRYVPTRNESFRLSSVDYKVIIAIQPLRAKGVLRAGTMPFGLNEDSVVQLDRKRLVAFSLSNRTPFATDICPPWEVV